MKIFNVRLGHANNSSSSHSLIFLDELIRDVLPCNGAQAFGRDIFTLASKESKMGYLAQIIYGNLSMRIGESAALKIASAWTNKPKEVIEEGYIDHQSTLGLPEMWKGGGLNIEFLKEFKDYLLQDNLVILGGDDEGNSHPLFQKGVQAIPFPKEEMSGWVARKDKKENYWSIFNRNGGTKLRFSFDKDTPAPVRAFAPELVDVKLTDYCPFGCSFCVSPRTLVLTSEMQWVAIDTLKPGDSLIGFDENNNLELKGRGRGAGRMYQPAIVESIHRTKKQALLFELADGRSVITSYDHLWLNSRSKWRTADRLRLGSTFFSIPTWASQPESIEYKKGYIRGVTAPATLRDNQHSNLYWRVAAKDLEMIATAKRYLEDIGITVQADNKFQGRMPAGWIRNEVPYMTKVEVRNKAGLKKIEELVTTPSGSSEELRGFVAGFYDAEGNSMKTGSLSISQKNNMEALYEWVKIVTSYGFVVKDDGQNKSGAKCQIMRVKGGKAEYLRFFGIFQPKIKRKYPIIEGVHPGWEIVKLVRLEDLGKQSLIDIKTSSRTFFANGLATHNCYQDSTLKGKHAKLEDIKNIAKALGELNVFEAALGGGEPTLHPDFIEILDAFRKEGVTPNFTTRSLGWLKNDAEREAILSRAGSFAYSVMAPGEITKLHNLTSKIPETKVTAQLVMGVIEREDFKKILLEASKYRMNLTLLGYKHVGRGEGFAPHSYIDWLEDVIALKSKLYSICIDTKLAADWAPSLEKANVSRWVYHTSEGAFSAYIDAVKGSLAPSSYGRPSSHRRLDLSGANLSQEIEIQYPLLEIQEELKESSISL